MSIEFALYQYTTYGMGFILPKLTRFSVFCLCLTYLSYSQANRILSEDNEVLITENKKLSQELNVHYHMTKS